MATRTRTARALAGLTTALAVLLAAALTTLPAVADPPEHRGGGGGGPAPVATEIVFDSLSTPSIAVPETEGAPDWFLVQGISFDVSLSFRGLDDNGEAVPLPLSHNKSTEVTLTGPDLTGPVTVDVPAGEKTASLTGLVLGTAADGVTLDATASGHKTDADGTSATFDVLLDFSLTDSVGGSSTDDGCEATPESPVCADLIAPTNGFNTSTLLSLGVCDSSLGGTGCHGSYVQALAGIVDNQPATDPATLVMKCDKTLCGGGAIKDNVLEVQLTPGGPGVEAEPCIAKGVATPESGDTHTFCVDYVQSTRDNAGDTHLFLLFTKDAKVRFP